MSCDHIQSAILFDAVSEKVTAGMVDAIARKEVRLRLSDETLARIEWGARALKHAVATGAQVYGVTTGLGAAVDTTVVDDGGLQRRIPLARAVGVGRRASRDQVRAIIAARIFGLCTGRSGASVGVVEALIGLLDVGVHPIVPMIGSVGAADLAPLAHIAMALSGDGEVEMGGRIMGAEQALAESHLQKPVLTGKDGLALVSANSASIGLGALLVCDAEQMLRAHFAAVALSCEAYRANVSPFDVRAAILRPAPGQAEAATMLRSLLSGGALTEIGNARRLQDPLSFRSAASFLGAALSYFAVARRNVELELNAAGDNPAVLFEDDIVLANANFDTTYFALSMETLGQAIARVAAASAERIMKLMSSESSGLPRFLRPEKEGRNGLATVQKTVSALVAEILHHSNPMPIVIPPVADRVEDYSTMAPAIVEKTAAIVRKTRLLTAIELLVAARGLDLRGSLKLGDATSAIVRTVRCHVPGLKEDRPAGPDIEALDCMIEQGCLDTVVSALPEVVHEMGT